MIAEVKARIDAWANTMTRLGSALDGQTHTRFEAGPRLSDAELSALYHLDDIAGLVCRVFARTALRRGFGELPDDVARALRRVRAREAIIEADALGRAFGGALIVVAIRDQPSDQPWTTPGEIVGLDVYDRRMISRELRVTDPEDPDYGSALAYRVQHPSSGRSIVVHRSRCLRFGGLPTAALEREARDGWDIPVLEPIYATLQAYNNAHLASGHLLSGASEGVLKIKGLLAALAGSGARSLETRSQLLSVTRSVARTIMLDAEHGEDYQRISASFSGIPETLDRFATRLSVATGIPPIVLGRNTSAGLGDAGISELRAWYDQVEGYRAHELTPQIERLLRLGWGDQAPPLAWPSLWAPTEVERLDQQVKRAQRDQIYLAAEVVTPEEIDVSDIYPDRDLELRAELPDVAEDVATTDDEDPPAEDVSARLAAEMTGAGVERCEHGRSNRCPLCGVERDRGVLPDGTFKRGAWRAIPR